jgi:mRNA-degrading endonuclease RelE of RelBE toxin-antitoxin system
VAGYFRLHVGDWRVLYRSDDDAVTVFVPRAGRRS